PARGEDVVDDLVVLGGVARPVDRRAVGHGVALELLEVVREVREGVLLDRRGERAQLLPFGHRGHLAVALAAQVPEAPVVELDVVLRLDELRGRFGMVVALHPRVPFITYAMCMNFTRVSMRSAQPFWCMRHDMSPEPMYSAPAAT